MSDASDAIVIKGVTKTFGPTVAVRDLDLVIPTGGLYGFIGPNGAGKTTTIRMIMSILFPDSGELSVLGHASALDAKDRIGYLPEERGVYKTMKVASFLEYIGRLKGLKGPGIKKKILGWLERIGLAEVAGKRCVELSKGMQQKIQFLTTILHEPDLLILDEPFSGLDPVNMRLLRDLVLEQNKRGATIIFSTHVMYQAEQLCDRVVMINRGVKVLDETLAGIRTKFDPRTILFEPLDPGAGLERLQAMPEIETLSTTDGVSEIQLADGSALADVMQKIVTAIPTARIEIHRPTLEDVFVQIVTSQNATDADNLARLRASLREESTTEEPS
jgi:ABC-2 type transport system ATP-binding protein